MEREKKRQFQHEAEIHRLEQIDKKKKLEEKAKQELFKEKIKDIINVRWK